MVSFKLQGKAKDIFRLIELMAKGEQAEKMPENGIPALKADSGTYKIMVSTN